MPVTNSKNLKDSIYNFLKERPNKRFGQSEIASFFECTIPTAQARLYDIYKEGKVRMSSTRKTGRMYWFESAEVEASQPPRLSVKAWKMPPTMQERGKELAEHRAANPSHFARLGNGG